MHFQVEILVSPLVFNNKKKAFIHQILHVPVQVCTWFTLPAPAKLSCVAKGFAENTNYKLNWTAIYAKVQRRGLHKSLIFCFAVDIIIIHIQSSPAYTAAEKQNKTVRSLLWFLVFCGVFIFLKFLLQELNFAIHVQFMMNSKYFAQTSSVDYSSFMYHNALAQFDLFDWQPQSWLGIVHNVSATVQL